MLVSELQERVESGEDRSLHTTFSRVAIAPDATHLEITGTFDGDSEESHVEFPLDELAESSLARHLEINKTYLHKCPPDLKTININHWMDRNRDSEIVFETSRGVITSIHHEDVLVIPIQKTCQVVTSVFNPSDEIVDVVRDDKIFQLDIKVANSHIEVPNPNRLEGRPEVGDITHGGVRILTHPQEVLAPTVTTYLHRIWCRNGSAEDYASNSIRLRGNTVDEVIAEMELKAHLLLNRLDSKLQAYANMANTQVPGDVRDFVTRLAFDRGVGSRLLRHLRARAAELPEGATLYDVQQLFTALANESRFAGATLLQQIGGEMAFNTDHVLHRCSACQQSL